MVTGPLGAQPGGFRRSFGGSFGLGFCGSLGLRGSLGLAAGTQREHHTEGKEQGKCFFHFFFPFFLLMDSVSLFLPRDAAMLPECSVICKENFTKKSKEKKNMLNPCKISVNFLFFPGKKASGRLYTVRMLFTYKIFAVSQRAFTPRRKSGTRRSHRPEAGRG